MMLNSSSFRTALFALTLALPTLAGCTMASADDADTQGQGGDAVTSPRIGSIPVPAKLFYDYPISTMARQTENASLYRYSRYFTLEIAKNVCQDKDGDFGILVIETNGVQEETGRTCLNLETGVVTGVGRPRGAWETVQYNPPKPGEAAEKDYVIRLQYLRDALPYFQRAMGGKQALSYVASVLEQIAAP
jgi:hypothetical protein